MKSKPLSDVHDVFLFDLDGVIYRGGQLIDGAKQTVDALHARGHQVGYVTNNSSRRPESIVEQLAGYGLQANPEQVVSSAEVATSILLERLNPPARVLVVGGEGLRFALESAGYQLVEDSSGHPEAVVQGFSPEVGWKQLSEAAFAIQQGALWIATNQDWTLPLERGLAPGNGTLVSAVHTAVGQLPTFAGKPAAAIFDVAVRRFSATNPFFIGDRLDTDTKGARGVAMPSAIVMTGVCTRKDLLAARPEERPDFILEDLRGILSPYPAVKATKFGYKSGAAEVSLQGNLLRVIQGDPTSIDALRAACATIWQSDKTVHMLDVDMRLL